MIIIAFYLHGLRYVRKFDARTERERAWDVGQYWIGRGIQVHIRED